MLDTRIISAYEIWMFVIYFIYSYSHLRTVADDKCQLPPKSQHSKQFYVNDYSEVGFS
jgi:hypothetical protein